MPDADLSATAKLLTIKELYVAMEISFDLRDDFDIYDEDDDRSQTSESEYYYSLAKVLDDCVSGVELNVKSSRGRILNVLIGIQADGNYVILSWGASE